jgi:hypothetical protein
VNVRGQIADDRIVFGCLRRISWIQDIQGKVGIVKEGTVGLESEVPIEVSGDGGQVEVCEMLGNCQALHQ